METGDPRLWGNRRAGSQELPDRTEPPLLGSTCSERDRTARQLGLEAIGPSPPCAASVPRSRAAYCLTFFAAKETLQVGHPRAPELGRWNLHISCAFCLVGMESEDRISTFSR